MSRQRGAVWIAETMSFAAAIALAPETDNENPAIVVGGGPAGMRCALELSRRGIAVTVLSAESYRPYNRVRLTPLLGGDAQLGEIALVEPPVGSGYQLYLGRRIDFIDRENKLVRSVDGRVWRYSKLVIATGSSAFVPGIPGRDLNGVYTFRTAEDASALLARSISARRVAIIGGGLLGLEAARGMRRRQCVVSVVEHERRLMPRQLDQQGAGLLAERIADLGVEVRTGVAVREITGDRNVDGLALSDGSRIDCDTVIICTGIRPNIDLARGAGLASSRGITVNNQLQTSDSDIYAVGECAEHRSQIYGLVGPGYAQADVAAAAIANEFAEFSSTQPATKLKVIGAEVFSIGDVEQLESRAGVQSHIWSDDASYRRVFVERGKLVGAIAVGKWEQASRVQDAVQHGVNFLPWMSFRFRQTGDLWPAKTLSPSEMPDSSIICNCTGVNCGQIRGAIAQSCSSREAIGAETGAGTVCGSCHPLLDELLNADGPPEPVRFWKPVLAISGAAALVAAVPILFGYVPLPTSYDAESLRTWLWRDNIVKQWTGFILLGIILVAMAIGLRKRLRITDRLGDYEIWRLIHLAVGLFAILGFAAHTGFRLGSNLNLWLGATFAAVTVFGAISGLATGGDHELRARRIGTATKPPRRIPTWLHILAVWPLPVLILIHVLASYAF